MTQLPTMSLLMLSDKLISIFSYLNQWINQPCVSHGMSLVEEKGFDFRNQWKVEGFDGFVWIHHTKASDAEL